jgi:hypothetical protein
MARKVIYAANALYRKFETNIPRNETAQTRSKFLHSCVCERFMFSHNRSASAVHQNRRIIVGVYQSLTDT